MKHITNRTWLPEHIDELRTLVEAGVSPARAGVRLKKSSVAVQTRAKAEGFPFPDKRVLKRRQRAKENEERRALGLA